MIHGAGSKPVGRRVGVKRQEGSCASGIMGNRKPVPEKEHPIDAATPPPRIRMPSTAWSPMPGCFRTLALHLGLPQLVDRRLDLGDAPGRANPGDKISTLVASALAGGDCIDDADAAHRRTACGSAKSRRPPPLRSFRWGHVRQLDRVSRELLARAWKAGAGPGGAIHH